MYFYLTLQSKTEYYANIILLCSPSNLFNLLVQIDVVLFIKLKIKKVYQRPTFNV